LDRRRLHPAGTHSPDEGGAWLKRIEHPLAAVAPPEVRYQKSEGVTAEAEQVQMLALNIRQHQGAGNPIEHIDAASGRRAFVRPRSSLRSTAPLNY
jgi:hypothetical protein